jgi:hypothetical protein
MVVFVSTPELKTREVLLIVLPKENREKVDMVDKGRGFWVAWLNKRERGDRYWLI